jgi:hypothetical protein
LGTLLFAEICLSWQSTFTNRRSQLAKRAASAE